MAKKPGPPKIKPAVLSVRVKAELKQRLEAAVPNDGTLSEEVERRLDESLFEEELFGSPDTALLLRSIATVISNMRNRVTKRDWLDDPFTFDVVAAFIASWLARFRPTGAPVPPPHMKGKTPVDLVDGAVHEMQGQLAMIKAFGHGELKRLMNRIQLTADEQKMIEATAGALRFIATHPNFRSKK